MRDVRFSVPDDIHAAIAKAAELRGIIGRYRVSLVSRMAVYDSLGLCLGERPAPIIAQPKCLIQRIEYEAYAIAKGFPDVEAFCLKSMDIAINRDHLTQRQQDVYVRVVSELSGPYKVPQLYGIAGK